MRRGRIIAAVVTAATAAAFAAPVALAATPQKIGADLADGRLDGTYSQQELADYVRNAAEKGYANPVSEAAPPSGILGGEVGETAQPAGETQAGGGVLPFTGFDLVLLTIGGFFLLALGALLRRATRERTASTGS